MSSITLTKKYLVSYMAVKSSIIKKDFLSIFISKHTNIIKINSVLFIGSAGVALERSFWIMDIAGKNVSKNSSV